MRNSDDASKPSGTARRATGSNPRFPKKLWALSVSRKKPPPGTVSASTSADIHALRRALASTAQIEQRRGAARLPTDATRERLAVERAQERRAITRLRQREPGLQERADARSSSPGCVLLTRTPERRTHRTRPQRPHTENAITSARRCAAVALPQLRARRAPSVWGCRSTDRAATVSLDRHCRLAPARRRLCVAVVRRSGVRTARGDRGELAGRCLVVARRSCTDPSVAGRVVDAAVRLHVMTALERVLVTISIKRLPSSQSESLMKVGNSLVLRTHRSPVQNSSTSQRSASRGMTSVAANSSTGQSGVPRDRPRGRRRFADLHSTPCGANPSTAGHVGKCRRRARNVVTARRSTAHRLTAATISAGTPLTPSAVLAGVARLDPGPANRPGAARSAGHATARPYSLGDVAHVRRCAAFDRGVLNTSPGHVAPFPCQIRPHHNVGDDAARRLPPCSHRSGTPA